MGRSHIGGIHGAILVVFGLGLAGCGGDDSPTPAAPAETREYRLEAKSDIVVHDAFATFTQNGDDKTTANIDLLTDTSRVSKDALFPTAIRAGDCSKLGDVERTIGELPRGSDTLQIDASFEDVTSSI